MGGALGLRAARCEPFGRGLSGAAREQPATVGVGPAGMVGGVLRGPRGTRTANGRGVRPLGSGTRLEPSTADRPHPGWAYLVVAVWLPTPRQAHSVGSGVENGIKERTVKPTRSWPIPASVMAPGRDRLPDQRFMRTQPSLVAL